MAFKLEHTSVIILLKSFVLGGAERQALSLANYLQNEKSCDVYIYSYLPSPSTDLFYAECEKYKLSNLYVVSNPLSASGRLKYLKRRIKIALFGLKLRKHKPSLIIPYLNPPSIIANLCYKLSGAKTTFWHHRGQDYFRRDAIEKLAVSQTKLFIANSPNGLIELRQEFQLRENDSFFLPNFSTLKYTNVVENKKKENLVIGMLAHFRDNKLHYLLVEAFHNVKKKYPNVCLVLAGNAYELEGYQKVIDLIEKHQLQDSINIVHNTEAKEILPMIDIGVLISKFEGMPNTIMEYMSYKLPIITSKHEGCEFLLGNKYEYFVDNKVEDITNKINKLLSNKEYLKRIGNENYKKLNDDFSIEKYTDTLKSLLKNV